MVLEAALPVCRTSSFALDADADVLVLTGDEADPRGVLYLLPLPAAELSPCGKGNRHQAVVKLSSTSSSGHVISCFLARLCLAEAEPKQQ